MMGVCALNWYDEADVCVLNTARSQFVNIVSFEQLFGSAKRRIIGCLNDLAQLDRDWDGYGAGPVSELSITQCKKGLNYIHPILYSGLLIAPNEWGGVQMQYNTSNGTICCDFGDSSMSYYVKRNNGEVEWYSFKKYSKKNFFELSDVLFKLS